MINSVSKTRIVPGLAYVLQTSQLEKALSDAGIEIHVDILYYLPNLIYNNSRILSAYYWLPNENVPYTRLYIQSYAIEYALRAAASEALLRFALPSFIDWLFRILSLPDNSTKWNTSPDFHATFSSDGLEITCHPEQVKVSERKSIS